MRIKEGRLTHSNREMGGDEHFINPRRRKNIIHILQVTSPQKKLKTNLYDRKK